MAVIDTYNRIQEELAAIALSQGRPPGAIRIVAVSKNIDPVVMQESIDSGIRLFGENRVQEAKRKIPALSGDFTVHMIGHLQSNKARDAVELFDCIHSIDTFGTAQKVDLEAGRSGKRQKILIQVNTSGEQTKSGAAPEAAAELARQVLGLEHLELIGLMTMAPFTDDEELIRRCFRTAKKLKDEINRRLNCELRELSMGMSADYRMAAEEGSTMVRIGTAIFGQRG
ncbi:MAG: YggS family pyridoxal phosphate enzyme [Spirochaetes bacterium RBG_16_49_21]|nr:MAG: YggS family pyridoxal phosphate enzyme [Spirochaetes bacterium RBG_16_49_21]